MTLINPLGKVIKQRPSSQNIYITPTPEQKTIQRQRELSIDSGQIAGASLALTPQLINKVLFVTAVTLSATIDGAAPLGLLTATLEYQSIDGNIAILRVFNGSLTTSLTFPIPLKLIRNEFINVVSDNASYRAFGSVVGFIEDANLILTE